MPAGLLDRIEAEYRAPARRPHRSAGGKGFAQPPFWASDALRLDPPPYWAMDSLRAPFAANLPDRERIEHDFVGYVRGAGKADAIVFACCYARLRVFSQARFLWQRLRDGQPGDLFTTAELGLLETPWPTGTTGDLLAWMEVDATFAGNSFYTLTDDAGRFGKQATGPGRRLARMRPDWVWIVIGSASDDPYAIDARPVAFIYDPRVRPLGGAMRAAPVILTPAEVCHYAPIPDPDARFRGMSWLTPVLREVAADRAAVQHKLKFFESGASLQTIVALDKDVDTDAFDAFVERFRSMHEGADNAYKTLFVGGGADVTVSSANLQQLDYKGITGGGETRIAAAAGVHPVIVGLSEGLAGSALNAGNYGSAKRNFAEGTLDHLWSVAASSLANLLVKPGNDTRLWYDDRHIPFLRDDSRDIATIQQLQAVVLRQLVDGGWQPDAAVEFLIHNDLRRLLTQHTGMLSVQLQAPGTRPAEPPGGPPVNGKRELPAEIVDLLAPALWRNG